MICFFCFSDVKIPFPTERHAQIAYDVLRIDPEPNRSAVSKQLQLESNHVIAYVKSALIHTPLHSNSNFNFITFGYFCRSFSAEQAKHIRVGVNAFLEAIILCTETMQQFGPPSAKYDYE